MSDLILRDVSRCVGRFGLGPDDPVCPRRQQCARYRQLDVDRDRWPDGYPRAVSVQTGMCRDGVDRFLVVEESA